MLKAVEPNTSSVEFGSEISQFVHQRAYLRRLDELLVAKIARHLGSRVLEVGCGAGTMTRLLLDRDLVVGIDIDRENVRLVQKGTAGLPNVICMEGDITGPVDRLLDFKFDSVVCSNVLEHIDDDALALRNMAIVLQPGGKLALVVPAGPWLYGTLDHAVGHYRRYSCADLEQRLGEAGFRHIQLYWFNAVGIAGWFVNGKLFRRSTLTGWQLRLFNSLTSAVLAVESRLCLPIGLSLIAVCTKA